MADEHILGQNIITALGITRLSDDIKVRLLDKMAALAEKRIALRLMKVLSEKDHREFEKIAGQDDTIKAQFLQEKVPNLVDIIQEEVVRIKKEMLDEVSDIDEDLKVLET